MSEDLERLEKKVDFILSIIVAQQKDVCSAAGIDAETLRRRIESGDVELLSRDGSRLNFIALKAAHDLKPRVRKYKRKAR